MKLKALIIMMSIVLAIVFSVGINRVNAQQAEKKEAEKKGSEAIKDEFTDLEVTGWRIRDFKPYVKAIQELEKLNKEFSENLLKLAIDEYSTGLDILEDMENEVIKIKAANKEKKNLNERFYWQEIDRKNQEQRQVAAKKYEAKMKAITYFTRSIDYLDQIQHQEIRQEPRFNNFQTRLFQVYVSTQYDLQNFMPCIPILERYVTLSDKNAKDIWAYKYMASCYGYVEKVLAKYRHASEDEINNYKNKKNRSMLQAVELKYGIESPHYKHMQEIVEQDEKKSERINDFK
jgi:hypothetical protein